jgi:hypothetical protein
MTEAQALQEIEESWNRMVREAAGEDDMTASEFLSEMVQEHPDTSRELRAALQGEAADLNDRDAVTLALVQNAFWG